jgi:hypothetical protein
MTQIQAFLTGVIAATSFVASLFFLKFWRGTKDSFFLFFAAFFLVETINRVAFLFLDSPSDGPYVVRLLGFLLILIAIVRKNSGRQNQ